MYAEQLAYEGGDTYMNLDERDLVDIDLEKLEEAYNMKELINPHRETLQGTQSLH
jgi:hypothetical protein